MDETTSLERLLAEVSALARKVESFDERLSRLEGEAPPEPPPAAPAASDLVPAASTDTSGVLRDDPFGPAVHRSSASGHFNAVNKALSMLGLVPDRADPAKAQEDSQRHRTAVNKAFQVLGIPSRRPSPPAAPAVPSASPDAIVPLPEVPADRAADAARSERPASAPEPVDLDRAVAVDLSHRKAIARDFAVPILNATVLLGVVAAALYASGALRAGEIRGDMVIEIGAGAVAVLLGAAALLLRQASPHLRGLLAGVASFALQAFALAELFRRLPLEPGTVGVAAAAAAGLGVWLVLQSLHPLGLFVGLAASLLLPVRLAPDPAIYLPFALAVNLAVAYGALRLQRQQASVFTAAMTAVLLLVSGRPVPFAYAAVLAAILVAQALAAPVWYRRPVKAAPVLVVAGFALFAWAVHFRLGATGVVKAGALFGAGSLAALAVVRLHRREEYLRGALKAAAVVVVLSALPAGFSRAALPLVALVVALLFGVFAAVLYDAYLRAAGALMLLVAGAMILAEVPTAPLVLLGAGAAAVLCAARPRGGQAAGLTLLLGALSHAAFLYGLALLAPPGAVALVWACAAIGLHVAGRLAGPPFLTAGGALAAGAASVGGVLGADPVAIGAAAVACATLHAVPARRGAPRIALFLLAAEVLAVAALFVGVPGPLGVLYALAVVGALAAPVWPGPARRVLHDHARLLALAVAARCLLPDVLHAAAPQPWLNLRAAAMLAATLPLALVVARRRGGTRTAMVLGAALLGALVATESGYPWAGVAAAVCALGPTWWYLPPRRVAIVEPNAAAVAAEPVTEPAEDPVVIAD